MSNDVDVDDLYLFSCSTVLPGPAEVKLITSNFESAVLEVVLPTEGSSPFTHVEIEFLSPSSQQLNITEPHLELGQTLQVTLPDLQGGTVYTISLSVYNYGGKGAPSQPLEIATSKFIRLCARDTT